MVKNGRIKRYIDLFFGQVLWGILSYPFITAFIYFLVKLAANLLKDSKASEYLSVKLWVDKSVVFYEAYPYWVILGSLFIGIFVTSVLKLQKQRQLIDSFGVNFFSEHDTPEQIETDWQTFVNFVEEQNTQHLYILGATGQETFQNQTSPLYKLVKDFQGELKVMLLDQQSDSVIERAHAVNVSVTDYRKEIGVSISYLKEIYKSKAVMKVKTYSSLPSWKMIMTDRYLWLQCYIPGVHVDNTPVYGIHKNDSNYSSLYELFFYDFHKQWNLGKDIDLSS